MTSTPLRHLDLSSSDYESGMDTEVLHNLSTAIVFCNADFIIEFTNTATHSLFECGNSQTIGTSVLKFFNDQDMNLILAKCLDSLQAATLRRIEVNSPGGRHTKLVDCIVTPLQVNNVKRLILELNVVNQAVRQLEENTMQIGQHANTAVIRAIAHEIKNPLGGLRGAAQLLDRELSRHPDLRTYTSIIVRETDRLCALIDSMSHTQTPFELQATNIHEVLEHIYHLGLAEVSPGFKIKRDYDPSLPPVLGNREQLIQAFVNMTRNAIEATGAHGQITLRTRVQRQVTLGKTLHMNVARIDIEDDGCGIAPELIDQIFYPMITSKARGEGLGLSIVHQIITRHGGSVSCESQPGRTVFTTLLKFADSGNTNPIK